MPGRPRFYFDNIATRRDANGNLILLDANITVTDTLAGDYAATNLRDWRKFTKWKAANSTGTKIVKYDYGSTVTVDTLIIFGHNLSGMNVLCERSPNNSVWTPMFGGTFVPTSNNMILKEIVTGESDRYFRVIISSLGGVTPEIGELYIGQRMEFPQNLRAQFNPKPFNVESQTLDSTEGHPLGVNVDMISLGWTLEFYPISNAFVEGTGFASFGDCIDRCYKLREPFFWAWDSTDHSDEIYLASIRRRSLLDIPYDRNVRRISIKLDAKTEDFET